MPAPIAMLPVLRRGSKFPGFAPTTIDVEGYAFGLHMFEGPVKQREEVLVELMILF